MEKLQDMPVEEIFNKINVASVIYYEARETMIACNDELRRRFGAVALTEVELAA